MEDLRDTLNQSSAFYRKQEEMIAARLAILPKGAIKSKKIGRETFFYLQYRKGKTVKSDYIGKLVPADLQEKLAERKRLEKELSQVREALKLLRSRPNSEMDLVEPMRSILGKMTKEKLWDAGLEIIGSWCFLLYQKHLPMEKYPLKTEDLDILVPMPFEGKPFDFSGFFMQLGLSQNFNPDGSIYFTGNTMKVEFLAPETGDGLQPPKFIKEISITPQLLRYLDILFEEPLLLKVAKGIKAKVPAPAAFTLHKLIICTRFKRKNKKEKDIRQAVYAGKYVLSEPSELKKLLRLWAGFPRPWQNNVKKALNWALEVVPLEESSIRQLKKMLT